MKNIIVYSSPAWIVKFTEPDPINVLLDKLQAEHAKLHAKLHAKPKVTQ